MDEYDDEEEPAGPDDRDRDLLDGSWEQRYYRGDVRQRDWSNILLGVALLVVISLVLPMLIVVFN